jgi:hypothetical protein
VSFRTHKEVAKHVQANTTTYMTHKVSGAGVVGTTCEAAVEEWLVKADCFRANSGHYFSANFANVWRVDAIHIIKNGTERLKAAVQILSGSPGNFSLHSEVVF